MSNVNDIQASIFYWFLVAISSVTAIINISVIRMFTKFRKKLLKRSSHNRILLSVCFADSLVGIFGTTLGILLLFDSSPIAFKLTGNVPLFSCMFASVLSLALLSADRLLAVKKPFVYGTNGCMKAMNRFLFAIWCVPLYVTLQQTIIFLQLSSSKELRVRSLFFSIFFCISFTSLVVTNSILYKFIAKYSERPSTIVVLNNRATENPPHGTTREESNIARDPVRVEGMKTRKILQIKSIAVEKELRQTSIMCIVIVVSFLALWTPLAVYRFLYAAEVGLNMAWLRRLALCLTVSNSLLNPAIYLSFRRVLRAYFIKQFKPSRQDYFNRNSPNLTI